MDSRHQAGRVKTTGGCQKHGLYENQSRKAYVSPILSWLEIIFLATAPTRRQIELALSEKELAEGIQTGQAAWISKGLKLEEAQYVV